jgi:hypothetical protein
MQNVNFVKFCLQLETLKKNHFSPFFGKKEKRKMVQRLPLGLVLVQDWFQV